MSQSFPRFPAEATEAAILWGRVKGGQRAILSVRGLPPAHFFRRSLTFFLQGWDDELIKGLVKHAEIHQEIEAFVGMLDAKQKKAVEL